MIRALFCDLDNTLIDRDAALVAFLGTLPLPDPATTLAALVALDRGGHGPRRAFYARLGEALGVSAARARARFRAELPEHVSARPGALDLLRRFPGPTFVLTNGIASFQREKARSAGLDGHVRGVLVSGEHGGDKPRAGVFRAALGRAGCLPSEALMVGDHPKADIAPAQALGLDVRFFATRWFAVPPEVAVVSALDEVRW